MTGAGSWAIASHLPNFAKRTDDVEFVAVARKGTDLLEKVKTDWGFGVASEDYRDVIDAGIDICLVASSPSFHYEHAKAAMECGAHVLVEKPFTIEPDQVWELAETAERLRRHLVVAFGWNDTPMVREAKRLMVTEGVGDIEQLVLHMASTTREQFQIDLEREIVWLSRAPDRDVRPDLATNGGAYDCDGPPDTLIDLALGRDADNCSPAWLAARTVDILDACYRSARSGAVAPIPQRECDEGIPERQPMPIGERLPKRRGKMDQFKTLADREWFQ